MAQHAAQDHSIILRYIVYSKRSKLSQHIRAQWHHLWIMIHEQWAMDVSDVIPSASLQLYLHPWSLHPMDLWPRSWDLDYKQHIDGMAENRLFLEPVKLYAFINMYYNGHVWCMPTLHLIKTWKISCCYICNDPLTWSSNLVQVDGESATVQKPADSRESKQYEEIDYCSCRQ